MRKISYSGYRFPPEIIHQAIWLYLRFTLSFRDVEDLLAERGIEISYETIRRWVNHFGPIIAAELRKRRPKPHAVWHLDEVYLKIDGRMVYLWRAVDADAGWASPPKDLKKWGDLIRAWARHLVVADKLSALGADGFRLAEDCAVWPGRVQLSSSEGLTAGTAGRPASVGGGTSDSALSAFRPRPGVVSPWAWYPPFFEHRLEPLFSLSAKSSAMPVLRT
jgi:hypothetical protein